MMSGGVCAVWLDRLQSGGVCANWWDLGGLVGLGGLYIYIYIYASPSWILQLDVGNHECQFFH
jgi:hypothetical protein